MTRCPACGRTYSVHERFCSVDGESLDPWSGGDPLIGCVLADRYRVCEAIGEGGMGTVYRAEDMVGGGEVALKLLRSDRLGSPQAARRLLREARILGSLDSPGTVRVYGCGELPGGRVYLAMELLVGRTLKQALRDEGTMRASRAIELMMDICEPVADAHEQGLIHRDLKPSNVFLQQGRPEVVRVLDFGIATQVEADEQLSRLTGSGDIPGTPGYVAPEVIAGGEAGPRADVYALGLILHELLSGRPAHGGGTSWQVLAAQLQSDVPPLDDPSLPASLVSLVARCTARDPGLRPPDAAALAEALARVELGGVPASEVTCDDSGVLARRGAVAQVLASAVEPPPGDAGDSSFERTPAHVDVAPTGNGRRTGSSSAKVLVAVAVAVLVGMAWLLTNSGGSEPAASVGSEAAAREPGDGSGSGDNGSGARSVEAAAARQDRRPLVEVERVAWRAHDRREAALATRVPRGAEDRAGPLKKPALRRVRPGSPLHSAAKRPGAVVNRPASPATVAPSRPVGVRRDEKIDALLD